jgi:alcohol dehydrogenase class IV
MSQGRNPFSDLGSLEALRIAGRFLARAVADPADTEARHAMAWAATLAGIAFGNAGVHVPHAMSYALAGLAHERGYRSPGYPTDGEPFLPHGLSVIVAAPAAFRALAASAPARHLEAARALGSGARGAGDADAGPLLAEALCALMRATGVPNGTAAVGFGAGDAARLARGAIRQARLVDNAPVKVDESQIAALFAAALSYS